MTETTPPDDDGSSAEAPPEGGRGAVFLLVEDDPDHARLVQRTLRRDREDNRLVHFTDGEEALRFLRKAGEHAGAATPDVMLLDLNLPRRPGFEILDEMKGDPDLLAIPVVIMTSSNDQQDRAAAYARHANSYVVKPVDFERFRQMVHDLSDFWGQWNIRPDVPAG